MSKRYVRVEFDGITDDEYNHIANLLWLTAKAAGVTGQWVVHHDGKTTPRKLNAVWDQYGKDARWE